MRCRCCYAGEVECLNPYQYKERTKERGKAWDEVASNLQKHGFEVTKRAVRDKFKTIKDVVSKRNSQEQMESGIAPELTGVKLEVTQMVEDLIDVEHDTKERQKEEKKKTDGVEMRKRALENYACLLQDEVQAAHWSHEQVTVHPIVCI